MHLLAKCIYYIYIIIKWLEHWSNGTYVSVHLVLSIAQWGRDRLIWNS